MIFASVGSCRKGCASVPRAAVAVGSSPCKPPLR